MTTHMRAFVAVTDPDWYSLLATQKGLEDVNFWQPGGNREFKALSVNELFLFKLHYPDHYIVGGGFFSHATLLPMSLAWETFGVSNGVTSLDAMRNRIEKYRHSKPELSSDFNIGCIILNSPFFLTRETWVPVPLDFSRNIVQGKRYDSTSTEGAKLFHQLEIALQNKEIFDSPFAGVAESGGGKRSRFGTPVLVKPRLGQAGFRIVVTDAYGRRCAATGERVLPVLQAAHIRPYSEGGPHEVANGILLRSDLHTLFDRGYVTVTPSYRLEISKRIREEYENGKDYYALHGTQVRRPLRLADAPSEENLVWHNENKFNG